MQLNVLNHSLIITEDECYQTLDVDVIDFDHYIKIWGNNIEEGGPTTLHFDSNVDPFEILFNENIELSNVKFVTIPIYHAYHKLLGVVVCSSPDIPKITNLIAQHNYLILQTTKKYVYHVYI